MDPESDLAADVAIVMDLVSAGRDDLAYPHFERLCTRHPDAGDLHWAWARCSFFLGHVDGALAICDQALSSDGDGLLHGRELVRDLVLAGRHTAAVLLYQRLGGGPVSEAQRWAYEARRWPKVAFFLVLLMFLRFGPPVAIVLGVTGWVLAFELTVLLAGRRFQDLGVLDRLVLMYVIEAQTRSGLFRIRRRDALALVGLAIGCFLAAGYGAIAAGPIPPPTSLLVAFGGVGLFLGSAGLLAFRRDLVRRRHLREVERSRGDAQGPTVAAEPTAAHDSDEPPTARCVQASGHAGEAGPLPGDGLDAPLPAVSSMEAEVRAALLPQLVALRRHYDIAEAVRGVDLATLDEPLRSQVAHSMQRVARSILAQKGGRQTQLALDLLSQAFLAAPNDQDLLRIAARIGRQHSGKLKGRAPLFAAWVLLAIGAIAAGIAVPVLGLGVLGIGGVLIWNVNRRRTPDRVTIPEGVQLAMRQFPRRADARVIISVAVALTILTVQGVLILAG